MFVTRLAQRNNVALLTYARMGFSSQEYDLAVIGGGPGGKQITLYYRIIQCLVAD
jgi:hypothetical protein